LIINYIQSLTTLRHYNLLSLMICCWEIT